MKAMNAARGDALADQRQDDAAKGHPGVAAEALRRLEQSRVELREARHRRAHDEGKADDGMADDQQRHRRRKAEQAEVHQARRSRTPAPAAPAATAAVRRARAPTLHGCVSPPARRQYRSRRTAAWSQPPPEAVPCGGLDLGRRRRAPRTSAAKILPAGTSATPTIVNEVISTITVGASRKTIADCGDDSQKRP